MHIENTKTAKFYSELYWGFEWCSKDENFNKTDAWADIPDGDDKHKRMDCRIINYYLAGIAAEYLRRDFIQNSADHPGL